MNFENLSGYYELILSFMMKLKRSYFFVIQGIL